MRTLVRWEPMSEMAGVSQRMDRLFREMLGRGLQRGFDEGPLTGGWAPAVDVLETQDGLEITAELPGMKSKDVDVTVEDGVLTIRGERKFEEAQEGETYHRVERAYGLFERSFTLPTSVDTSMIEAQFGSGVMTITLPKREESKPRSVKVKVSGE